MERSFRILFVLEHFYPYVGGAETLFLSLTEHLVRCGCQVSVVTTRHLAQLPEYETYKGIEIHRLDCRNRFRFTYASVPTAIRLARKADIVHTSSYTAALPAFLASKVARKPLSITFHEYWGKLWFQLPYLSGLQRILYYTFEQLIISLPYDRMVAVSDYTQDRIQKRKRNAKVVRIYNGIDYGDWREKWNPSSQDFNVLYLGRLGISKGLNLLLESADHLLEESESTTIRLILPDHPRRLSEKIHEQINQLRNKERMVIIKSLPFPELKQQMCKASCIVIPSYAEGFGYVGVEAQAMQIPIVSSQCGALRETIGGKYIPMDTLTPEALTQALRKAQGQLWEIKEEKKFPLERTVNEYLNLLGDLVNEKAS